MKQEVDRGKRHDINAIDQGLIYLARAYGKARKASRLMKEDGLTPIPPSTLDHWKKNAHVARYEQLRAEWEKRRDLDTAERMDALVSRALDIEEDILEKTAEKVDKIDPRDLANAFKNLAIGSGVLQDKSDRLRGKPAGVIEHRHDVYHWVEQEIAKLEREALEAETVDAEVVEEQDGG
ncbi:MAG: hypothetical protein M3N43_03555 [Actinomycetota bacterium]|nr:hypothetical protein [Actinomycetota bacterium]